MNTRKLSRLAIAGAVAMLLSGRVVIAQQPPSKGEMPMGNMPMDMVKQCHEQNHAMSKSVEQLSTDLADAKKSNDAAKMGEAIDRAQKQLGDMKQKMDTCGKMMHDMEKMHGGMMK